MFPLSPVLLFCCPHTASCQRRLQTFKTRSFCKHPPPCALWLEPEGSPGRSSRSWCRAVASQSPPQSEYRRCCLCSMSSNKSEVYAPGASEALITEHQPPRPRCLQAIGAARGCSCSAEAVQASQAICTRRTKVPSRLLAAGLVAGLAAQPCPEPPPELQQGRASLLLSICDLPLQDCALRARQEVPAARGSSQRYPGHSACQRCV